MAQSPLLELDDGSVIAESLAIIEYLEELHPDPPLFGTTPFERAQVRVWERRAEFGVLLQGTRRFLHTSPYFAERIEQSPKVAEEAGQVLSERLSLFNTHLQDNEWLAGAYSVADISLFVAIEFAAMSNFPTRSGLGARAALARGHTATSKRTGVIRFPTYAANDDRPAADPRFCSHPQPELVERPGEGYKDCRYCVRRRKI